MGEGVMAYKEIKTEIWIFGMCLGMGLNLDIEWEASHMHEEEKQQGFYRWERSVN